MIAVSVAKELRSETGPLRLSFELQAEEGSIVTLFGRSGVGKTTSLRMLAGLTDPDEGTIEVNGVPWFDSKKGINRPPQERRAGLVFQDYALFPSMTARENIAYACDDWKGSDLLEGLIERIGIGDVQHRKPHQLSGGQKQKVAIARALAARPRLLLLDEPLSAVDLEMRRALQDHLLEFRREFSVTIVLVSHDLPEIFRLSDKVCVIDGGSVIKSGTPGEVFSERNLSGKFSFSGEVVEISKQDIVYVVSVVVGNNIVKVMATENDMAGIGEGSRVLLVSKASNPLLIKI